jgi:TPR repeat protein
MALAWWRKAGAWRFIADAYACGLGVPQSMDAAVQAYTKASAAGDMQSVMQLGNIHAGGCARVPDVDLALTFYERAAGEGYPEAQLLFGELLMREGPRRSPGRAYLWARLAELRLPDGELRTRAQLCAAQAARELPPAFTDSSDEMARGIVTGGSEPMKR